MKPLEEKINGQKEGKADQELPEQFENKGFFVLHPFPQMEGEIFGI